jgi:hypothetical protein
VREEVDLDAIDLTVCNKVIFNYSEGVMVTDIQPICLQTVIEMEQEVVIEINI